jgi:hypothetical protein
MILDIFIEEFLQALVVPQGHVLELDLRFGFRLGFIWSD